MSINEFRVNDDNQSMESHEIKIKYRKDELHLFDKIVALSDDSNQLFLFTKNSNTQLKRILLDMNKNKEISRIYPFHPEFFKFEIIDVISYYNNKLCLLYVKENKTNILIINTDDKKEIIYSDFLVFNKSIENAKIELNKEKNILIILLENKFYFLNYIKTKKIYQIYSTFALKERMEKKIKKNEGEENEDEEDKENVVQEEEKEGYEEEDEEKIIAFLLFKNKTILVFTNTYFFLLDIKLLKITKTIFLKKMKMVKKMMNYIHMTILNKVMYVFQTTRNI